MSCGSPLMGVSPSGQLPAARTVRDLSKGMAGSKRERKRDRTRSERSRSERSRSGSAGRGGPKLLRALRTSGEAARERLSGRPAAIGSQALALLGSILAIAIELLVGLGALLAAAVAAASGPASRIGRKSAELLARSSEALTPRRGLLVATIGCAVLLGLSQFADYRGVAIGVDNYSGLETVAPAPELDRAEAGSAHGYALVPAALLAIAIVVGAARTGRWRLCRLAVLIGLAAIAVAVLIDRPTGLDEGALTRDFTGVQADLLEGFWVQIAAGAGLAITAVLLGTEIRRAAPSPASSKRTRGAGRPPRRPLDADARARA